MIEQESSPKYRDQRPALPIKRAQSEPENVIRTVNFVEIHRIDKVGWLYSFVYVFPVFDLFVFRIGLRCHYISENIRLVKLFEMVLLLIYFTYFRSNFQASRITFDNSMPIRSCWFLW